MSQAGSLCKDLRTSVTRNKNHLCDYMSTEPARLAGIPAVFAGRRGAARRINQARNRTTGNTLIMLVLYIKMAAPGWPFSCNTGIKVTSAELASPAHVIRPLLQGVLLRSLHVTR